MGISTLRSTLSPSGKLLFICLASLALLDRILVLTGFHFNVTDIDQLISWCGTKDYAQLTFREPCFYGQDYNLMFESLLATPLIWMGIHVSLALPIVTAFLSVLPFALFSIPLVRNRNWTAASLVICWPALLPLEYSLSTGLSRGFIAGIAISSFSFMAMGEPQNRRYALISVVLAPISYLLCPNSTILSIFILASVLPYHFKDIQVYLAFICSTLFVSITAHLIGEFYFTHPERVTNAAYNSFKSAWIKSAFQDGEMWYSLNGLIPLLDGVYTLPIMLMLAVALYRKDHRQGLAMFASIVAVVGSFGVSRVYAATTDVFYPYLRFWFSIPVIFAIGIASLFVKRQALYIQAALMLACSLNLILKQSKLLEIVAQNQWNVIDQSVPRAGIRKLAQVCHQLDSISKERDVNLIMLVEGSHETEKAPQLICYGCRHLEKEMPPTLLLKSDRLTWEIEEYGNGTYGTIMVRGLLPQEFPADLNMEVISFKNENVVIVKDFGGTTFDLIEKLGCWRDARNLDQFRIPRTSAKVR